MSRSGVIPLFKVTATGEVRAKGEPLSALWSWFFSDVTSNPAIGMKRGTVENYRRTRDLSLMHLNELPSDAEVLRWTLILSQPPHSMRPSTVHHHWKNLRALYRWASDGGLSQGNPCAFMELARPEVTPHYIGNMDEVLPLLLDSMPDDRARAFLLFDRYLGRRRGEVLGLRRQSVVRESADCWRVDVVNQRPDPNTWALEQLKNGRGGARSIPVKRGRHPLFEVCELVMAMPPAVVRVGRGGQREVKSEFLFPYREWDLKRFMEGFRAVAPLSFPKGRAWHSFRHSLAVEMNRKGAGDEAIAELLGHSSTYVTRQTYMGVWGQRVRSSVMDSMWSRKPKERAGAPPGFGARGGSGPVGAGPLPRRNTKSTTTKQGTPCNATTETKKVQRALPGLAVGPLVPKPPRGRK